MGQGTGFSIAITTYIYIYNSVVTCRHNIINSSASAPLSAKKIAVKKISDVYVSMFGPAVQRLRDEHGSVHRLAGPEVAPPSEHPHKTIILLPCLVQGSVSDAQSSGGVHEKLPIYPRVGSFTSPGIVTRYTRPLTSSRPGP